MMLMIGLSRMSGRLSRPVLRGLGAGNRVWLPDVGGFTTHDLKRCQFTAMTVALAYNWWSLFVRLAHPQAQLEAITSRPLLLSGIGRLTHHGGQSRLTITALHGKAAHAKAILMRVSERLKAWKSAAEQLAAPCVWQRVCEFIVTAVTGFNWLAPPTRNLLQREAG
jgi:hypothetical protein